MNGYLAIEPDGEGGTKAELALHGDLALVLFDHLAGNRKPQPDAAEEVVADLVHVEKAVENARHDLRRDAHAVVGDANEDLFVLLPDLHHHLAAIRAEQRCHKAKARAPLRDRDQ